MNGVIDYETPHATPWSYEDGIRIGSGSQNVKIHTWEIRSGDDCIALNNEASECQDAFTSPIDSRVPVSNTAGAGIYDIEIFNISGSNYNGNLLRMLIGTGMTNGDVAHVNIFGLNGNPASSTSGGSAVSFSDQNSSSSTRIHDIDIIGSQIDCANLTLTASVGAVWVQSTGFYNIYMDAVKLTSCTQTYGFTCSNYMTLNNCSVDGAGADSVYVATGGVKILGGNYSATTNAIHLAATASHTTITGIEVLSAAVGIIEDSGADYTTAIGNDLSQATAAATLTNVGPNSIYQGNTGLNPGGSLAVGTTGSPMNLPGYYGGATYTISGGTVSNIAVNGVNTGLTSGTFTVGPNESVVITYSAGPTIVLTKH